MNLIDGYRMIYNILYYIEWYYYSLFLFQRKYYNIDFLKVTKNIYLLYYACWYD